jgi:peptidoglycan/xylan/chitin deacetylase (PgdA/CDA1 family)
MLSLRSILLFFIVLFFRPTFTLSANEKVDMPPSVPVLMYHSISNGNNTLCVPPNEFEQHLKWMIHKNFTPITAKDLYTAWRTGQKLPPHPIVITLDDGYADNFTYAFPLIEKYGIKATIFMITAKMDTPRYLTAKQLSAMETSGKIDIESHTVNHPDLRQLTSIMLKEQLVASKRTLEEKLHKEVPILCYPSGKYNKKVVEEVDRAGYGLAFTTHQGLANLGQGRLTLHRVRVTPHMDFQKILNSFNN